MPRTFDQLSLNERVDFLRTVRGELPGVPNPTTAGLARRFDLLESAVDLGREVATTPAPKAPARPADITKTLAEAARERWLTEAARERWLTEAEEVTANRSAAFDSKLSAGERAAISTQEIVAKASEFWPR